MLNSNHEKKARGLESSGISISQPKQLGKRPWNVEPMGAAIDTLAGMLDQCCMQNATVRDTRAQSLLHQHTYRLEQAAPLPPTSFEGPRDMLLEDSTVPLVTGESSWGALPSNLLLLHPSDAERSDCIRGKIGACPSLNTSRYSFHSLYAYQSDHDVALLQPMLDHRRRWASTQERSRGG